MKSHQSQYTSKIYRLRTKQIPIGQSDGRTEEVMTHWSEGINRPCVVSMEQRGGFILEHSQSWFFVFVLNNSYSLYGICMIIFVSFHKRGYRCWVFLPVFLEVTCVHKRGFWKEMGLNSNRGFVWINPLTGHLSPKKRFLEWDVSDKRYRSFCGNIRLHLSP